MEPVETAFGRKRRIDQSACNQDLSCVDGFCPSFVTLEGAEPAKPVLAPRAAVGDLPEPTPPEPGGAVAVWRSLSGDAGAVRLGPRSADPVPPAPADALRHEIVRPLSFSPL